MTEERKPRDAESRKAEARPTDSWIQPSELPVPNKVEGWEFRYIRTASLGNADVRNVSRKFREGWTPVKAADHPELNMTSDVGSQYPDGIEVGGLLLCKIPSEIVRKRKEHFTQLNARQIKSVNEGFLNDQDTRMPKYNESRSRTEFRKG